MGNTPINQIAGKLPLVTLAKAASKATALLADSGRQRKQQCTALYPVPLRDVLPGRRTGRSLRAWRCGTIGLRVCVCALVHRAQRSLTCGGASYEVVRYQFDESGRGPEPGVSGCSPRPALPLHRRRCTEHHDRTQRQVGPDPRQPRGHDAVCRITAGVVGVSACAGASNLSAVSGPVVGPTLTDPAVEKVKRVNDVDHRCLQAVGRAKPARRR
jgi:hypothetical protein